VYTCVCVFLHIQSPLRECRSIRSGASGLPYYCAPLVCVSEVIEVLAVWRHNKPKTKKKLFKRDHPQRLIMRMRIPCPRLCVCQPACVDRYCVPASVYGACAGPSARVPCTCLRVPSLCLHVRSVLHSVDIGIAVSFQPLRLY